ncbi:hypothetical protein ABID19_005796 [Mesorhizobium robiniae]|uniref:Uncharacterized protein n=1 Tax=Mesorhizobium robiniae TaxID=559315 RepID=A0ABV2GWQ9_9HYPH|nr:hypothetical protein [Mesorhizobium sp. ZC-5]MCV3242048.1 hypothetical protein [Mesorhizobium sp. ZC-5]
MTTLTKHLGTVIVTTDGTGLSAPGRIRTFPTTLMATVDPGGIERNEDGCRARPGMCSVPLE